MPERDMRDMRDIRDTRERDILVAPNEYAYVQDLTKGDIVLYVGPTKISLSNTERLVEYLDGRFTPVRGEENRSGVCTFVAASSSQYIILENPPKDPNVKPVKGANYAIELLIGRKVVVSGPATFPLWPGQRAKVIDGHELREDQYLVVRFYDQVEGDDSPIGTEKIIKGSQVSFYIPRTGLEVVPDASSYVRRAVTLLDGEYCILLAPNGKRRYQRGPAVVVPEPMEEFVSSNKARVYKAEHLKKNLALHLRVVRDFTSSGDQVPAGNYTAGQELCLKDREGFFYPTEDLEVLNVVQAIPLADKEGVYVRDIDTGRISNEVGPRIFLTDPTRQEVVSRALTPETRKLYGIPDTWRADRAIPIYIPPSCAVLVTAKDRREVVRGPEIRILAYDEELEVLKLSTGKPKSEEHLLSTAFLQTAGNKVSDIVKVKTSDHVELEVALSYRVTFQDKDGKLERWFNVNNYVGLLCDHLGSIVRAAVRNTPIDVFHATSADVIRNAVLGEKRGEEKRAGRSFEENGMWVYDVEVLDVRIQDNDVKALLSDAQRTAIRFEVTRKQEQMRLDQEKLTQMVTQEVTKARATTSQTMRELEEAEKELSMMRSGLKIELDALERIGLARNQSQALELTSSAELQAEMRKQELELKAQEARVTAFKEQMGALAPELVATLKTLGDQHLATELTRNLSPLAILGGESVAEVASRLLKSLPIQFQVNENGLTTVATKGKKA